MPNACLIPRELNGVCIWSVTSTLLKFWHIDMRDAELFDVLAAIILGVIIEVRVDVRSITSVTGLDILVKIE